MELATTGTLLAGLIDVALTALDCGALPVGSIDAELTVLDGLTEPARKRSCSFFFIQITTIVTFSVMHASCMINSTVFPRV